MGGYGSGRHYWSYTKSRVEDCFSVDSNNFARWKLFKPGYRYMNTKWTRNGQETGSCGILSSVSDNEAYVTFLYNDQEVRVNLAWYMPGYKGRRFLFICPACGRRVRTLHFKNAEIACRKCHDLTYASCNESHYFDNLYKRMAAGENYSWQEIKWAMKHFTREARMKPKRPRGRPRKHHSRA